MEDHKIITLYWNRDEAAIRETNNKYGSYCHRIAMNILQVLEDAVECLNDLYHRAWNTIPPERPQVLRAWLGRIVRNLSINRLMDSPILSQEVAVYSFTNFKAPLEGFDAATQAISLTIDPEKTTILLYGFNGCEYGEEGWRRFSYFVPDVKRCGWILFSALAKSHDPPRGKASNLALLRGGVLF